MLGDKEKEKKETEEKVVVEISDQALEALTNAGTALRDADLPKQRGEGVKDDNG